MASSSSSSSTFKLENYKFTEEDMALLDNVKVVPQVASGTSMLTVSALTVWMHESIKSHFHLEDQPLVVAYPENHQRTVTCPTTLQLQSSSSPAAKAPPAQSTTGKHGTPRA